MVDIRFIFQETAIRHLRKIQNAFSEKGLKQISRRAALPVQKQVRDHIGKLAGSRHSTAERLGAKPSNVLNRVHSGVHITDIDDGFAAVSIPHKMFRRAFRDIEITPDNAKALAIPIHAAAYNKAPLTFSELFVWRNKKNGGGNVAFLARNVGKGSKKRLELLYVLKSSVRQKQDRSMLPDDASLQETARQGVSEYLAAIIQWKGSAA